VKIQNSSKKTQKLMSDKLLPPFFARKCLMYATVGGLEVAPSKKKKMAGNSKKDTHFFAD
jgi:hypothetical protein